MPKHTPGPWSWRSDLKTAFKYLVHQDGDAEVLVLEVNSNAFEGPVTEANARLIETAPKLLWAAKGLIGVALENGTDEPEASFLKLLQDVIREAEGK